ncbi:MAG: isoprenylcysteine carboxylmethyltransferase family protein [Gemmatimonadaceae bacterium]|nr:isoprenylcysteine carboxylmethyltransferase family protein [Gloeobacterales cyanobacterium ES-bin-141]
MADDPLATAGVIAPPPLIFAGGLILGLLLLFALPLGLEVPLAGLVWWVCVGAGAVLVALSFQAMQARKTPVNPLQPTTNLVAEGPYGFSRNPIYVGFTLIYFGLALLASSLWPFVLLAGVLIIMERGVVEREEAYLERKFGEEYRNYKARVRRWV